MNRAKKTIIIPVILAIAALSAFRNAQAISAKKIKEEKA